MHPLTTYLLVNHRHHRRIRGRRSLQQRLQRTGLGLGALLGLTISAFLLLLTLAYADLSRDLPSPDALTVLLSPPAGLLLQPTRLYDRTGAHLLYTLETPGGERRYLPLKSVSGEHLPDELAAAVVAAVDPGFWNHPGVLLNQLAAVRPATIAEQLVANLVLENDPPDVRRALRMRLLAAQITSRFGREKILEWYLNSANFGHLAFGADAAARLYLGKPASQLSLAESALLASVAQAPALNPIDAPQAARTAQQGLLDLLQASGALPPAQIEAARNQPLSLKAAPPPPANPARAFTTLALSQLARVFGQEKLERGGLVVTTTLDYDLQMQVGCTAQAQLQRLAGGTENGAPSTSAACPAGRLLPNLGAPDTPLLGLQLSIVVTDPQNGQVLAYLGETDSSASETAVGAAHPAGSLLTPLIHLAAYSRGYNPASLTWDIPASLPASYGNQQNPDGRYHGPQRLRMALANDYLIPSAQLLDQIGPETVWKEGASFGLSLSAPEKLPFDGGTLTPVQAAQFFGVFANQGLLAGQGPAAGSLLAQAGGVLPTSLETAAVLTVVDTDGVKLLDWSLPASRPIISSALAYLVNHVLSDEPARWPSLGYPNPFEIGRPAGAHTGQTASGASVWASGYTPQLVTVVWAGISTTPLTPLNPRMAMDAWHAVMQYASRDMPAANWSPPAGIKTVVVCDPSGLLPTADCPNTASEVFLTGSEPTSGDYLYRAFQVNRETGLLATIFTPADLVDTKTYLVVPSNARQWASAQGLPVPPSQYDLIQPGPSLSDANLTAPALFAPVHGTVEIRGTAAGPAVETGDNSFASYHVQAGAGLNPRAWVQIGTETANPVRTGVLAAWNTTQFEDGLYAIRLVVTHTDQQVQIALTQVTVDNTPPTVHITYPRPDQAFTAAPGTWVVLQAEASDATGLERLEWWLDGQLLAAQPESPWYLPWQLSAGGHSLVVKAFDRAGNQSSTTATRFTIPAQ